MSELAVEFDGASGKKGKYTISVKTDEGTGECEIELPYLHCEEGVSRCKGNALALVLDESVGPCKTPLKDQKLLVLKLGSAPSKAEIVVTRDRKEVAKATVTPAYETLQPNGEGCGPTCRRGSAKVTLK